LNGARRPGPSIEGLNLQKQYLIFLRVVLYFLDKIHLFSAHTGLGDILLADAGSATGDHGGLSRQFLSRLITHIFSFLFFVVFLG